MPDPVASTADTELLARVEQVLGPTFELDHEVGRGGMGIVYLARDRRLKRPVAIKVLPPELAFRSDIRSRFLREAETAAQLSHPNIVPIFTVDERGGLVLFVMAYIDGQTLAQRLQGNARVPVPEARRLLTEVASALAYAHTRGVIHRDIKPDNILLSADGDRAMVTDFGIARAVSTTGSGDSRLTATGMAIGTPAYMSPEQCAGDREVDGRSDLYSLGVVAYQMLCGSVPFSGSGTGALLVKHISEKPVPLTERAPEVPAWLARIVMRLLEKQPSDRFADAGTLVRALEQGEAGADGPATRSSAPSPAAAAAPPSGSIAAVSGFAPAGMVPVPPAPSSVELTRWSAPAVVRFRKRFARLGVGIVACVLWATFGADTDPLGFALVLLVWLAWKYARLWSDGYDWRDVFKQPRDRLFFDAAAESIDGARAMFDKDKRARLRARMRQINAGEAPAWATAGTSPRAVPIPVAPPIPSAAPPASPLPPLPAPSPLPSASEAASLASPDVLGGPYGPFVRDAATDRLAVRDLVARLGPADRALLPDVVQTVDALVGRIASLATALHRLDGDLAPQALPDLDKRIGDAEAEPAASPDRERKLALLRRQRVTLQDLADRRDVLRGQLEAAGLVLKNIRYDLLRLRSAGVQSAIDDVASATQEARALSREIAHLLSAAEELRTV
jgi:eukaryotic-like serine/threonine-protein kinase